MVTSPSANGDEMLSDAELATNLDKFNRVHPVGMLVLGNRYSMNGRFGATDVAMGVAAKARFPPLSELRA